MRFKRNPLFWVAAVISLVLDHLTKFWVVQNFDLTVPPQTQPLLPGVFHFTYVVNTGAAFSLFSNGGVNWLRCRRIHQWITKKSSASDKPENGTARGWLIENRKSKIENRKSKIENRLTCWKLVWNRIAIVLAFRRRWTVKSCNQQTDNPSINKHIG